MELRWVGCFPVTVSPFPPPPYQTHARTHTRTFFKKPFLKNANITTELQKLQPHLELKD